MTIVIIDDARIIREGLRKIIETNCPQYHIVGEAADGEKGFELLSKTHPDVCIVDMKMPKVNGIEMVARIRKVYQDIQFIVLSGYAEFEYARSMMSYGCSAYLLKPVDHKELISVLNSMKEQHARTEQLFSQGERTYQVSKDRHIVDSLLEGSLDETRHSLIPDELLRILDIPGVVAVARNDHTELSMNNTAKVDAQTIGAQAEIVCENINHYSHMLDNELAVLFIAGQEAEIIGRLHDLIHSIKKKYKLSISIGYCCYSGSIGTIRNVYQMASDALNRCFHRDWGALSRFMETESFDDQPLFFIIEEQIFRNLTMEHHAGTVDKIRFLIHELKYHEVQKEHCILLLNRIYVTIRKVLVKQHAQQLLDDLPKSVMFKDILLRCDRMVQVEEQIEAINKRLMEYASETSKSDSSKRATVRKVLRYMDQNYHKSLSLVEIAKIAHMAPSYFSMYFKKEMGENYITFANRMKIEKAKELLQDPSIKIYEVCSMVGFDDSKYFSRKFRAITGMTPKEYRDSIRVFIES